MASLGFDQRTLLLFQSLREKGEIKCSHKSRVGRVDVPSLLRWYLQPSDTCSLKAFIAVITGNITSAQTFWLIVNITDRTGPGICYSLQTPPLLPYSHRKTFGRYIWHAVSHSFVCSFHPLSSFFYSHSLLSFCPYIQFFVISFECVTWGGGGGEGHGRKV